MNDILTALPPMKSGKALFDDLAIYPEYSEDIITQNEAARLIALSDLYRLYYPSPMTIEIYSKLYLALLRSLQKKITKATVKQQNENYKAIRQQEYSGILGGADSFTIIGTSGIGKSAAINRAIDLLMTNGIITTDNPYTNIIPCVVVQCPFDSSVKGLLFEILRKVDESLNSNYYNNALRVRATTDMLIGSVSQVALNHIGLLVVDEIQNVVNNKHGKSLVGMLTQLINNSGISIAMVGTPESSVFFEQAMQLARRSLGLQYQPLAYDSYFQEFCGVLFSYQYTKCITEISEGITEWLYEHSGGIISVVISLIHDAQEIAILSGKEMLNIETLSEAYKKRLSLLHGYIEPSIKQKRQTSTVHKKSSIELTEDESIPVEYSISDLANIARSNNRDIVELLKEYMTVEEVAV